MMMITMKFILKRISEKIVSISMVKKDALKILNGNFPDDPKQKIENCADEWSKKQVTTAGLVNYYKAYYNSF